MPSNSSTGGVLLYNEGRAHTPDQSGVMCGPRHEFFGSAGGLRVQSTGPVATPYTALRSQSPTRRSADQHNVVTIIRHRGEGLGCVLDSMMLADVKPNSPASAAGAQRFLGLRLTHVNSVAMNDAAHLLDTLENLQNSGFVTLQFGSIVEDASWRPGALRHAVATPAAAYPPTYLHPPMEGRMEPLPPSSTPLYRAVEYDIANSVKTSVHSARARSEAVCARVGMVHVPTYPPNHPRSEEVIENLYPTSTFFAVDRSPAKFTHDVIGDANGRIHAMAADIGDADRGLDSHHRRSHLTTRDGVGDPTVGLSNITLPPQNIF